MKVTVAIDSFKGSLSSIAAGEAAAAGIRRVYPDAEVRVRPLADGGEGTVDALVAGLAGVRRVISVTGPTGKPVTAAYGILPGGVAVLEMAAAAGITLVAGDEKNPLYTTTYGVGEMISDAVEQGCRRFLVGIGGSATNDGGAGMLQALGIRLLDANGNEIPRGGAALADLARVEIPAKVSGRLSALDFKIACDVTNPLCGEKGASAVFGPQKGATPAMVSQLDAALGHFAAMVGGDAEFPGTGAAGGLGFAFRHFLGGQLQRGVEIVLAETHLEDYVRDADVVITGEGRLDSQTVMGKAPIGVAQLAKRHGKPVLAFSGCVTPEANVVNDHGIDAFFPILRAVTSLEEALAPKNASVNLAATVEQVFRALEIDLRRCV
ncbi:MAG: glycerate kinase [Kiritimatiellae bacterium]|nr:glycerate kinase [Kiritimatiellia bacterium]